MWQNSRNTISWPVNVYRNKEFKDKLKKKMDSETDFSSDSDYNEFAHEILFVGDILLPFQFEPVFTAAEITS